MNERFRLFVSGTAMTTNAKTRQKIFGFRPFFTLRFVSETKLWWIRTAFERFPKTTWGTPFRPEAENHTSSPNVQLPSLGQLTRAIYRDCGHSCQLFLVKVDSLNACLAYQTLEPYPQIGKSCEASVKVVPLILPSWDRGCFEVAGELLMSRCPSNLWAAGYFYSLCMISQAETQAVSPRQHEDRLWRMQKAAALFCEWSLPHICINEPREHRGRAKYSLCLEGWPESPPWWNYLGLVACWSLYNLESLHY